MGDTDGGGGEIDTVLLELGLFVGNHIYTVFRAVNRVGLRLDRSASLVSRSANASSLRRRETSGSGIIRWPIGFEV